jgi:hypothetical protein
MSNTVPERSLSQDIGSYLRYQLRGRRGLLIAAAGLALPALWFGWPLLVAAGAAPLLIAFAPCAIMCALGICAMRAGTSANPGQASCCEKSPASDEVGAAGGSQSLTSETAAPAAVSQQLSASSVHNQSANAADSAGPSGEVLQQDNEEKAR